MSIVIKNKLNSLFQLAFPGAVLTSHWLHAHGFSNQLVYKYVKSGWLTKVGQGAYLKVGDQLSWEGMLFTFQQESKTKAHIGGRSALQLLGNAHFLGHPTFIDLFTSAKKSFHPWLYKTTTSLGFAESKSFFRLHTLHLFSKNVDESTLFTQEQGGFQLIVACPERAIMEMLSQVPQKETYEHAYYTMQNLTHLRTKTVLMLLKQCNSIKVKRLFLHIAECCQHEWVKKIPIEQVNLGSGKRVIYKGGYYDARYQLYVPQLRGNDETLPSV